MIWGGRLGISVKERALAFFEKNRGIDISGEAMARELSVSRNAVWKAVNALREEGYNIEAGKNRGYRMAADTDIISAQSVKKHLLNPERWRFKTFDCVDSTNTIAKEAALSGESEGLVIMARSQKEGRGRRGRSFFSPPETGIYMSLLLRPRINALQSLYITTSAAVAAAQAIEEISGRQTGIKWVNDVYIEDKKVCGILTEAALDLECGGLEYAVLGIGINVSHPENGFPSDIKSIAAAVFGQGGYSPDEKSRLAARVLDNFYAYYTELERKTFLSAYIERSLVTGREILILENGTEIPAKAVGIDEECRLIVSLENGSQKTLSAGDVSIKF